MKARITVCVISLAIAVWSLVLGACSKNISAAQGSDQSCSENGTNNSFISVNLESSTERSEGNSSDNNTSSIPNGRPTFLIGPDGKAIYTSEITRLENTDKTAETLTKDDLWADVYCDGFAYYKEPCGIGYDSYKNPELFEGRDFLGDRPENNNQWKRVNVGDEICGLRVKSATAHFYVCDRDNYTFPAYYFRSNDMGIELEGTIEVEGFLQVNYHSDNYFPTSETIWFYPSAVDLPLDPSVEFLDMEKGFETRFEVRSIYNINEELLYAGEFDSITLGRFFDVECDMDGIGVGDVAYARVTLKDIRCIDNRAYATLEKVELLSEILSHNEEPTMSVVK